VLFGIGLLIFCAVHFEVDLTLAPLFVLMGSIVFASGILLFASIGFWLKQFYASAEEIYFNFNLMASRPAPIFTGVIQVIALTLIPVGLMTHIPIEYVFSHRLMLLGYSLAGVAGYAALAVSLFYLGLRHYESGNRFGVRG